VPLTKLRDYLILAGLGGSIVALDQWTKFLVRSNLQVGESWMPVAWLAPLVRVVHWHNTGAAFGLFPAGGLLFTVIAIFVSAAIIYYYPRVPSQQVWLRLALAMQLGGALGNLIDRLVQGTVTDFISIARFPVFNVADATISLGVAILVVTMWLEEQRVKARLAQQAALERAESEERVLD
jgi:signal peptidase II